MRGAGPAHALDVSVHAAICCVTASELPAAGEAGGCHVGASTRSLGDGCACAGLWGSAGALVVVAGADSSVLLLWPADTTGEAELSVAVAVLLGAVHSFASALSLRPGAAGIQRGGVVGGAAAHPPFPPLALDGGLGRGGKAASNSEL